MSENRFSGYHFDRNLKFSKELAKSVKNEHRQHITYVVSNVSKSLAFEWISTFLNIDKFKLSFIFLNPGFSDLEEYLKRKEFEVYRISYRGKKDLPKALIQTLKILKKLKPQAVHCHLIDANIIGLFAAKWVGIKKRIYTRHHSSLHHVYYKKGVFWDKLSNNLATDIVAISGGVQSILTDWENVPAGKIHLIPHGFRLEEFRNVSDHRIQSFRERTKITAGQTIIGVVSRWTKWKGIQYIIPAFKKFLATEPSAILLLLNAHGDFETEINALLAEVPEANVRRVAFEKDVAAAYQAMSLFVHVPIDNHSEAFGQTYVEALAAGVPSVFTLSGIAIDFIVHEQNALVVPFEDAEAIHKSMTRLMIEQDLRETLVANGKADVAIRFPLTKMIGALENLYEQ